MLSHTTGREFHSRWRGYIAAVAGHNCQESSSDQRYGRLRRSWSRGIVPICCIINITSIKAQCWWANPSSPKRTMSILWMSIALPLAGHS
jgi:hypothetical protein